MKKQKRTQRKLIKRVSDLEVKLAAARQELLGAGEISPPLFQPQSNKIKKPFSTKRRESPAPKIRLMASTPRYGAPKGPQLDSSEEEEEEEKTLNKVRARAELRTIAVTADRCFPERPPSRFPSSEEEEEMEKEEPRITRSRFVPGALPTLHSERLLSGHLRSENGIPKSDSGPSISGGGLESEAWGTPGEAPEGQAEVDVSRIGRAMSTDYAERREGFEWPDYVF